jgi:kynureninase
MTPDPARLKDEFAIDVVYANTAMYGLPPRMARDAGSRALSEWCSGQVTIDHWQPVVEEARNKLAELHGAAATDVTLGAISWPSCHPPPGSWFSK